MFLPPNHPICVNKLSNWDHWSRREDMQRSSMRDFVYTFRKTWSWKLELFSVKLFHFPSFCLSLLDDMLHEEIVPKVVTCHVDERKAMLQWQLVGPAVTSSRNQRWFCTFEVAKCESLFQSVAGLHRRPFSELVASIETHSTRVQSTQMWQYKYQHWCSACPSTHQHNDFQSHASTNSRDFRPLFFYGALA